MPYKIKGKCVFRKDTGKKVGCTKGNIKKYLGALHANVKESKEKNILERLFDTIVEKIDREDSWEKYLTSTPQSCGSEYYELQIPNGVEPPKEGSKITLNNVRVVTLHAATPEDIAKGRGGPCANYMKLKGIAYKVNCLPEGHERLKYMNQCRK